MPKIHITVAVVIPKDGKFLMVQERQNGKTVFNQPAGHLEYGENLIDAAIRETLEETCWHISPEHFLGVSTLLTPHGAHYVRHTFIASAVTFDENASRDKDIDAVHWLELGEIKKKESVLRSPLVLGDITRYLNGQRFPLSIIEIPTSISHN